MPDFAVGLTGLFNGGRIYVLDMVRGRFDSVQLPQTIAAAAAKWHALRVGIENDKGVQLMDREIKREMRLCRYYTSIEYT